MADRKPAGTALVTGASSGIGAIYAERLAARGHDLIIVGRNEARLEAVADTIRGAHGCVVEIVAADLTDKVQLAGLERRLRNDATISMLVNNAGFGAAAALLQADVDKMDEMILVNVTAVTRLTYAAVPGFVERSWGTIINIASIVAVAPEILNGVYGASKAFILAFSQSLQKELADKGVRVQVVLPGATATGFWDIAGNPASHLPPSAVMSAQDLVDASLSGLDAGELVTIPALPDDGDWKKLVAARKEIMPKLSSSQPASRYGLQSAA